MKKDDIVLCVRYEQNTDLLDYKVMCFNGEAKCSFVCSERYKKTGLKVTFFDNEWKVMPFERQYPKSENPISKPVNFEKMKKLAQELARDIPFLRADFYEVAKKIYVGEVTLYPGGGFESFTPPVWDEKMGDWLALDAASNARGDTV